MKVSDKIIIFIIIALVFSLPFFLRLLEYNFRLLFAQFVVAILLIIFAFKIKINNKSINLDGIILLFILSTIASYIYSPFKYIGEYNLIILFTVFGFYFVFTNVVTSDKISSIFYSVFISAVIVSIYGLLQFVGLDFLSWGKPGQRIISTLGNATLSGSYLSLVIPMGVGLYFLNKRLWLKRLILLGLGVISLCLFLTFSRGSILAALIGISIFGVLYFKKSKINFKIKNKKKLVLIIVITLLVLSNIGYFVFSDSEAVKNIIFRRTARILIYKTMFEIIKSKPLIGYGLGSLPVIFMKFRTDEFLKYHYQDQEFLRHAHNKFFELWVERGIINVILFILLIGMFFYKGICSIRNTTIGDSILTISALGALSSAVVLSFCMSSLSYISVNFYLWLAFSVIYVNYKRFCDITKHTVDKNLAKSVKQKGLKMLKYDNFKNSSFKSNFIFVLILVFAFILIGCGVSSYSGKFLKKAETPFFLVDSTVEEKIEILEQKIDKNECNDTDYYNLATLYAKKRNWDKAIENFRNALSLNPENKQAYNNLGNVYFNLNEVDPAISNYAKAINIDENYLDARYNLGIAYFAKGDIDKVIKEMNYVLKKDPDYTDAKEIESYIANQ